MVLGSSVSPADTVHELWSSKIAESQALLRVFCAEPALQLILFWKFILGLTKIAERFFGIVVYLSACESEIKIAKKPYRSVSYYTMSVQGLLSGLCSEGVCRMSNCCGAAVPSAATVKRAEGQISRIQPSTTLK